MAMIAVGLLMPASGAAAADNYGAIAYSRTSGARAYSHDYSTRAGAETRALGECRARGRGCKIVTWYRNACGALASGPDGWGASWSSSRRAAENKALAKCSTYSYSCGVLVWSCTTR
ncbi:DUF4189 domain-containing protein [Hoeflea marina]|nr:DUF4189 domain-containing protein [Hoeflea marina]